MEWLNLNVQLCARLYSWNSGLGYKAKRLYWIVGKDYEIANVGTGVLKSERIRVVGILIGKDKVNPDYISSLLLLQILYLN